MKIDVKGTIISDDLKDVYDWYGVSSTSPSELKAAIKQAEDTNDNELIVEINSGGGSVWAAAEMYYALKNFKGTVHTMIPSVAASAASFLALAGNKVSMSILAQLMIHNATNGAQGNYQTMADNSEFLRNTDRAIINAYMVKTNKSEEELLSMMNKTTWMTAQQAKDHGFVDEILFNDTQSAVASANNDELGSVLPQAAIDKARAQIAASKGIDGPTNNIEEPPREPTQADNKGGNKVMDLQTLQNEHPELFKQVKNMGYADGVKAENARIKSIEEIAVPGNDALANDAKYVNPVPAATFAINALKAQKQQSQQQLQNMQADATAVNEVPGSNAPTVNPIDDIEKEAQALANIFKGVE